VTRNHRGGLGKLGKLGKLGAYQWYTHFKANILGRFVHTAQTEGGNSEIQMGESGTINRVSLSFGMFKDNGILLDDCIPFGPIHIY